VNVCRKVTLEERGEWSRPVYVINSNYFLGVDADPSMDKGYDIGARLMLLKKVEKDLVRVYVSKGSGDSYILRPTFFRNCGGHELLIFAETGTEYSWGLRVFAYDAGVVHDLGDIPLAVESDNGADSVIPFMRLIPRGKSLEITFTTDLIRDPGGQEEKKIAKSAIRYRINGNSLVEVPSP
jgi:hypothetical protein